MTEISQLRRPNQIPTDDLPLLPGSLPVRPPGAPPFGGLTPEMRRALFLDSMVQMVAAEGFADLTVERLAQHCGLPTAEFPRHFAGLEDCLLAAFEQGADTLLLLAGEACQAAPTWPQAVRDGLQVILEVLSDEEPYAQMSVIAFGTTGPRARAVAGRLHDRFHDLFTTGLSEHPGMPSDRAAEAVASVIHAVLFRHIASGRTGRLPELLPLLTYVAILPWLTRDEAAAYLTYP